MWAPDAAGSVENALNCVTRFVRQEPLGIETGDGFVLARWGLGLSGGLDSSRRVAFVGTTRESPPCVELKNACRLGGDYALIGVQAEGLVVARGHHAGRCLYYARLPGRIVAACSRLEPLVSCMGGSVTPNVQTLAALMLARPSTDRAATVFNEIRRVEASQALLLTCSGVRDRIEADIEVTVRKGSPDELAEEMRSVIDKAIQRAIDPMRRVGVLVSGGLDSSAVLARAVALSRGANRAEVEAITWSFAGPGDDRPYLKELCEDLRIVPVCIESTDVSPHVGKALVADSAPTQWATSAAIFLAQDIARQRGAEALLTGMGGDHIFNGDARVFAQEARFGHFWKAVGRSSRFSGDSYLKSAVRTARLLASPLAARCPARLRLMRRHFAARRWPWAGPRVRDAVMELVVGSPEDRVWEETTNQLRFQRLIKREFLHAAETRGQTEVATGLMRIDPLLDDEVVSTVAGFPQRALLFGNRYRGLFRHAMCERLPERLRLRPGKGRFEPAIAEVVCRSNLAELRSLATMQMSAQLGLVDPRRYYRQFDETLTKADGRALGALWPALTVEAFVRSQWGNDAKERTWSITA